MQNEIKALVAEFLDEIINIRRHIHANPELSFEETKTSAFVKDKLKETGIAFLDGFASNGILGIIKGSKPGKTVALRGDMDALPIEEENELPFKSLQKGVMHACGHDIHTACLLGAAKVLHALRDKLSGTILLVFQPGEERLPGGAKLMLEDGVFKKYVPDLIIGQHVYPELPAGHIGMRPGMYMASADELYLKFKGKGGHAALPQNTVDTVLMASQAVVSLQQVISRNIPTQVPAVLSFGNIVCNSVMNVIPETVELQGTLRLMNEEWREKAHQRIHSLATSVAEGMGGSVEVDIQKGFPCLYNHEKLTLSSFEAAKDLHGAEQVHQLDIRMTAEDFAWFAQAYPACFYRLGVGHTDGTYSGGLHSPKFLPNEAAIQTGCETMAYLAWNALEQNIDLA